MSVLFGHETPSPSKYPMPTMLEYSSSSLLPLQAPFLLFYWTSVSLPDFSPPPLSFSLSFPCGRMYHDTPLEHSMTTSLAALLCNTVPAYPQGSLLCLMPTQFLPLGTGCLLSGAHSGLLFPQGL